MILGTAYSVNDVPIRLTEERWEHILDEHAEFSYNDSNMILEAVEDPEYILSGRGGFERGGRGFRQRQLPARLLQGSER